MYIIKAESGLYIIRKTDSSADRIVFCHNIKSMLKRKGLRNFDSFECSGDGRPFFEWDGANYIMTRAGREAPNPDYENSEDFKGIMRGVSRFHKAASFGALNEYSDFCVKNTVENFLDKGAQLNRLRRLIYRKKRLDDIDYIFLKNYEYYYKLTQEAAEGLMRYGYDREEERAAAEGQIIINNADEEAMLLYPSGIYYTELLKLAVGSPLEDLRLIITRYLKKNSRPDLTAKEIIKEYSVKRPLNRQQINILYYLLIFPERYIKTYSDYYRKGHVFTPIYVKEAIKKIIDNRERHSYWISELLK